LLKAIENGIRPRRKVEEELLRNFEVPSIQSYTLLNSTTRVKIDSSKDMMWKLIVFSMTGLSGLLFSPISENWVTLTFDNKGKEGFMPLLLQHTSAVVGSPIEPLEKRKQPKTRSDDIQSVCKTL